MGALDGTSPARGPTLAGAGAASAFRPKAETRALTSSQPVPANFRSRPPALRAAPRSAVRRATPSGGARVPRSPLPSHSFGSAPGQPFREHPGPALSAGLGTAGLGAAAPRHQGRLERAGEPDSLGIPRGPLPRPLPVGSASAAGERSSAPGRLRGGSPSEISVSGTLWRPKSKEKVLREKLSEALRSSVARRS